MFNVKGEKRQTYRELPPDSPVPLSFTRRLSANCFGSLTPTSFSAAAGSSFKLKRSDKLTLHSQHRQS